MRIPSGILWHRKIDEILAIVSFCIFKNLGPFPACLRFRKTFERLQLLKTSINEKLLSLYTNVILKDWIKCYF